MSRKVLVGLLAAFILGSGLAAVSPLHSNATPEVKSLNSISVKHQGSGPDPSEVFALANQAREAEGLPALKANPLLTSVAEARATDMAKNHYYGHKDKDGHFYYDLFPSYNFKVTYSCENLDLEYVNEASRYVNDWLYSPFGQRECLMNKEITDAGYAVTQIPDLDFGGRDRTAYIVVAIYSTPPNKTQ